MVTHIPLKLSGSVNADQLITLYIVLAFIRGISFFRLFSDTRYIIQLLLEVIKATQSFAILLMYVTISFSLVFLSQGDNQSYYYFLKNSLLMNVGQSKFNFDEPFTWIIFASAIVFNVLIMMNMLIAIMSETFAKGRQNTELGDYIQIAKMVLEVESVLDIKNDEVLTYFQLCAPETALGKEDEVMQELKSIKKMLRMIYEKT